MRAIRKSGKIIGSERVAVITALNLANELLEAKGQVQVIDGEIVNRIDALQQKIDSTLANIDAQLS